MKEFWSITIKESGSDSYINAQNGLFRRGRAGIVRIGVFAEQPEGSFTDGGIAENCIDLCSDKQNVHAGIEPEHTEHDGGKAAVDGGVITEIVNVIGEQEGKSYPAGSGKHCTGKLAQDAGLTVGKGDKNQQEEKD